MATSGIGLSSHTNDDSNSDSNDDLEKTLVLAAADADSRNFVAEQSEVQEAEDEPEKVEHVNVSFQW